MLRQLRNRLLRAPLLAALVFGLAATFPFDSNAGTDLYQLTSAVSLNQSRQAEAFWGNDMPYGEVNPLGQSGTYIIGTGHATLTEYLVNYGWGTNATLYVNAISDKPPNVIANVYVDGYYKGAMYWTHGDNQRHLGSFGLSHLNAGFHTIAIQFQEATFGSSADTSRWLYLDDLAVVP